MAEDTYITKSDNFSHTCQLNCRKKKTWECLDTNLYSPSSFKLFKTAESGIWHRTTSKSYCKCRGDQFNLKFCFFATCLWGAHVGRLLRNKYQYHGIINLSMITIPRYIHIPLSIQAYIFRTLWMLYSIIFTCCCNYNILHKITIMIGKNRPCTG